MWQYWWYIQLLSGAILPLKLVTVQIKPAAAAAEMVTGSVRR